MENTAFYLNESQLSFVYKTLNPVLIEQHSST